MAQVIVARRGPLVVFQRGSDGAAKIVVGNDTANAARYAGNSASSATLSQAWAEGTEPGGPGTKSAKGWAGVAQALADAYFDEDTISTSLFEWWTSDGRLAGKVNSSGFWDIVLASVKVDGGFAIEEFETTDPTPFYLVTADGYLLGRLPDTTASTALAGVNALAATAVTSEEWETTDPDVSVLFITSDGYLLGKVNDGAASAAAVASLQAELTAARGSRAVLADRVGQYLTPYGMPRKAIYGAERLRKTHSKLYSIQQNDPGVTWHWGQFGDSWSHVTSRYTGPVAANLLALPNAGFAGPGWQGFGYFTGTGKNGNVQDSIYTMARTGTWVDTGYYSASDSPDICSAFTSTVGSRYSLAGPDASLVTEALHYWIGTADGVVQYRWNGGSWTTMNAQGSGLQWASVATGKPSSGAWTLDIELVSGSWNPAGLYYTNTSRGVRISKLAASGSQLATWAGRNQAQFQAGLTSLALDLASVMLLTNDRTANRTPAQFSADMDTLLGRIRAALPSSGGEPYCDLLIIMPPQTAETGLTYSQPEYADACYWLADKHDAAFIDLQRVMGPAGNYTNWLTGDLRHPALPMNRLITDTITKTLVNA